MFKRWHTFKENLSTPWRFTVELLELIFLFILCFTLFRQLVFEKRSIPSWSMYPTLQVGDELIVEKISLNMIRLGLKESYERGDVIVFYPPAEARNGRKLKKGPIHSFIRLTGFSGDAQLGPFRPFFFMPNIDQAYIKRIVGLPGDRIEIKLDQGVFINGQHLGEEAYVNDLPRSFMNSAYYKDILKLSDIDDLAADMKTDEAIIVPEGHYFCLGDNRNGSSDGHIWGFVEKDMVIGRAYVLIWRDLTRQRPRLLESAK